MKNKLLTDLEYLNELNFAREDNVFHLRIILSKNFENHRGQREVLSENNNENKGIVMDFLRLQHERSQVQIRVIERYKNTEIDPTNKNILFNFLSKTQKTLKHFYIKLQILFNKFAEAVAIQHNQFHNELRQLSLERITCEKNVYEYFEALQKAIHARFKRELSKFINFYTVYGILIDKRGQRQQIQLIKQQKYLELTKRYTITQSIKYNIYLLRKQKKEQRNPYGILDIEDSFFNNNQLPTEIIKEEGICETIAIRMQRVFKQLLAKNNFNQKAINKFYMDRKSKQTQIFRSTKLKQIRKNSVATATKKIKATFKSINARSISQSNQQRSVIRQTLIQMNINERTPPLPLNKVKVTDFPATSFNFYKQKLTKTQLLMLFRKRFPIIMKQNL